MGKINLPQPKKLPSGNFRIQFQIEGKRYSVTGTSKVSTIADAEKLYIDIRSGIDKEKRTPLTVGKAINQFIDSQSAVLSPATIAGYKNIRENHFKSLMNINLSDLKAIDIQKAVGEEVKNGKSPKSIRNYVTLLTKVLNINRPNFHPDISLPQKEKHEAQIPSEEDLIKILKAAKGTRYELPILLASWLGLRASEIRGLKFGDIQDGRIHIQRAVVQGEDKAYEKLPKTAAGDRWILLPEKISNLIHEVTDENKDSYICPIRQNVLLKAFHRICREAGVPEFRFHDLRHFQASEAHSLGVPDKYVMKRMGHATDNMLKTVYEHAMKDKVDSFTSAIDAHMESLLTNAGM